MSIIETILEFLQVILSWPVAIFSLGLIFIIKFKAPITNLIHRTIEVKAAGASLKAIRQEEQLKEAEKTNKAIEEQKPVTEMEKYVKEHTKEAIEEYGRTFIALQFERAFNVIYGSQIRLLDHLFPRGESGDKYINLMRFYEEYSKLTEPIAIPSPAAKYFGYLLQAGFIQSRQDENQELIVSITLRGVNFITYLRSQYPKFYKVSKPF